MAMPLQRVPSPPEEEAMTYDEISMQQSRQFLDNLQELKNLRPQLYSAAEYCELSYMNSDHKQMIVENLKDYAVRALVNTVDHLGSVSYKLNDLVNQQTNEVSATQLRIACLEQGSRGKERKSTPVRRSVRIRNKSLSPLSIPPIMFTSPK